MGKKVDLTGQRFGKLVVLVLVGKTEPWCGSVNATVVVIRNLNPTT